MREPPLAGPDRPDPSIFDGLSCPSAGPNDDLVATLAVEHARNVVSSFLSQHAACVASVSTDLRDQLERFCDAPARYDATELRMVWDPAFGDAHAFLLRQDGDPAAVAALIGLRLTADNAAGDWDVRLDRPQSLRFGPWTLPAAEHLTVEASSGGVTIHTTCSARTQTHAFVRGDHGWTTVDADAPVRVGSRRLTFDVLLSSAMSPGSAERLLSADAYAFSESASNCSDGWRLACHDAAELIALAAPDYVDWVARVVNWLTPVSSEAGTFNSGSERFSPGVVCMSDHALAWPIAEMLVHEASHQYMNLLTFVDPLVNGADEQLYFSPFRNKDRPLFFILAAYHAFGNVLAFYKAARAHGRIPDENGLPEAFLRREAELERQLSGLAEALSATHGLTDAGQALFHPLRQHLRH